MPKKKNLIEKLYRKPYPKNFTTRELDALMSRCNCTKFQGGRGSGIGYVHNPSKGSYSSTVLIQVMSYTNTR